MKDTNFYFSSKEKVAVLGGTGAGKSSLVSALLRMPDHSGKVIGGYILIEIFRLIKWKLVNTLGS